MSAGLDEEAIALRQLIERFIREERLQPKLDKLKEDDHDARHRLLAEHAREAWLAEAAKRAGQIQLASHTLKPIHPDARGSNLYPREWLVEDAELVGTHALAGARADDVVGNAAALDVFKLLKLSLAGRSVLNRALADDDALARAFSDDLACGRAWASAFARVAEPKGAPASHTLARQVYFPLGDGGYHLLAPLFPSTLAHAVYQTIQTERFGEAAQAARAVRKQGGDHPHGYREFPNLGVQKFGGTKPQNISQLNSERRGEAYLLPSLPPLWNRTALKPPTRHGSVFDRYGAFAQRPPVREALRILRDFLRRAANWNNIEIRRARDRLVEQVLDELSLFTAEVHSLPPGWSRAADCRLGESESRWLDPFAWRDEASLAGDDDWPREVADRFARWFNARIESDAASMGDEEHRHWRALVQRTLDGLRERIEEERPDVD